MKAQAVLFEASTHLHRSFVSTFQKGYILDEDERLIDLGSESRASSSLSFDHNASHTDKVMISIIDKEAR